MSKSDLFTLLHFAIGTLLWIGLCSAVAYYAQTLGRSWRTWFLIAFLTSPTLAFPLLLWLCLSVPKAESPEPTKTKSQMTEVEKDMRKVARILRQREKPTPKPVEPTQIEKDMREVARILNEPKRLSPKIQWLIVAGALTTMIASVAMVASNAATPKYAITADHYRSTMSR
jgi:hypothetical protein